jgi:hypothetical protein
MPCPVKSTILDIETPNAIGARLFERADQITQVALQDLALDLRLAARVCDRLASVGFRIAEIAQAAIDHPEWDSAAFARDLRELLKDAGEDA